MATTPSKSHFSRIQELWQLVAPLEFHRRVENFIYFSKDDHQELVIRLTEPSRRKIEDLKSELHWQNWMSGKGARCATPLPSINGNLVETLEDNGETFFVCVFERAEGAPLKSPSEFTPGVMQAWGRTVAQLHNLTRDYRRPTEVAPRKQWREDFETSIASIITKEQDPLIRQEFNRVFNWLNQLPREMETYGLVHTDLHQGNFFVSNETLTVFDFDDCCYHWFMYDLAVPLFYLRYRNASSSALLDLSTIEKDYLAGYASLRKLNTEDLVRINGFVRYRALVMYGWCVAQIRAAKLDSDTITWCGEYIQWCKSEVQTPVELT